MANFPALLKGTTSHSTSTVPPLPDGFTLDAKPDFGLNQKHTAATAKPSDSFDLSKLPAGFVLDEPTVPDLPRGFTLDTPEVASALPEGFFLDDPLNPAGTGVGRAVERGLLRTGSTLPSILAQKDATRLADAQLAEADLIRQVFLETTRLPDVPEGVDISTPELASAAIAAAGYPASFANTFRQTYDIRARDLVEAQQDPQAVLDRGVANLQAAQDLNQRAAAIPNSPGAQEFRDVLASSPDTVSDTLNAYLQNPGIAALFLGETAAESLPQIAAAGATTLATRSPAAGAAVLGGGTVAQEFGSSAAEFFAEKGVAVQTPEDAAALLRDTDLMSEASRRGLGRGVVIALFEMAGQGAAAQTLFKSATKEAAKDVAVQAATGGGGEAAARVATGQELSAQEIITEALAEGVTAPLEVGPAAIQDARSRRADGGSPGPINPGEALSQAIDEQVNQTELPAGFTLDGPETQVETAETPENTASLVELSENDGATAPEIDESAPPEAPEIVNPEVGEGAPVATPEVGTESDLTPDSVTDEIPVASADVETDPDAEAVDFDANTAPPARNNTGGAPTSFADGAPELGAAPTLDEASQTRRQSNYEQAYRDAGMEPDEAVLLPPARKVAVLSKLWKDKIGINVQRGTGRKRGKANDATENLLDGYRNMQSMAHSLGLPVQALSLGGKLNVSMDGKSRSYLGLYDSNTRTIHMPERSNSFAHEWAHALDHFLLDKLRPGSEARLLSRHVRGAGLDPKAGFDGKFINLVHSLFFDEADLAVQAMRAEQEASATVKAGPNAGQPTKAAQRAQEKLERLLAGATKIKVKPSNFRGKSKAANPAKAGYFGSVHELLARAFEAYVASKVGATGGSNEFIAKGDQAYLNDADAALADLYPKATDRLKIFAAFDEIMNELSQTGALTEGRVTPAADKPADMDVLDPAHWAKLGLLEDSRNTTALKEEMRRIRNGSAQPRHTPLGVHQVRRVYLGAECGDRHQKGRERQGVLPPGAAAPGRHRPVLPVFAARAGESPSQTRTKGSAAFPERAYGPGNDRPWVRQEHWRDVRRSPRACDEPGRVRDQQHAEGPQAGALDHRPIEEDGQRGDPQLAARQGRPRCNQSTNTGGRRLAPDHGQSLSGSRECGDRAGLYREHRVCPPDAHVRQGQRRPGHFRGRRYETLWRSLRPDLG